MLFLLAYWYLVYIRLAGFVLFLLAYWYLVYIRLVLCYSYLPIVLSIYIYTPGFVLFLYLLIGT